MSEKTRMYIVDPVNHCEWEIDDQLPQEISAGELTVLHVPEELECCGVCGTTFPRSRTCCPWLLFLAVTMLMPRGDNLEIPANKKALEFVLARKSEIEDWWKAIKTELAEEEARSARRSLIHIGLLTENS